MSRNLITKDNQTTDRVNIFSVLISEAMDPTHKNESIHRNNNNSRLYLMRGIRTHTRIHIQNELRERELANGTQ